MASPLRMLQDIARDLGPFQAPQTPLMRRVYREQQALLVYQSLTMGLINMVNGFLAISLFFSATPIWQLLAW